jgi:hypothetical protein
MWLFFTHQNRGYENQEVSYLAIDQHRKQVTVDLRDEQGDVLLKRQVSTAWNRVHEFLEEI